MSTDFLTSLSVVISLVALCLSTWIALTQHKSQRHANYLPAVSDLLDVFRSIDFHQDYNYLTRSLAASYSPDAGVSGLPDDAQRAFFNVAYLFQKYAILADLGILDRRQVTGILQRRMTETWTAIAPYVEAERRNAGAGREFLRFFESFAQRLEDVPPGALEKLLSRKGLSP
jgi:hypothetical protein